MQPKEVDHLNYAIGITDGLLPPYDDIPLSFKKGSSPWCTTAMEWLDNWPRSWEVKLTPKPGIDHEKAVRHIVTILRSTNLDKKVMIASVAYLLNIWFEGATETNTNKQAQQLTFF